MFYINSWFVYSRDESNLQEAVSLLNNPNNTVKQYFGEKNNPHLENHPNCFNPYDLFSSLEEAIGSFEDIAYEVFEFNITLQELISFIRRDKKLIPIRIHYFVYNEKTESFDWIVSDKLK